jgi:hypothetical protein
MRDAGWLCGRCRPRGDGGGGAGDCIALEHAPYCHDQVFIAGTGNWCRRTTSSGNRNRSE